MPAPTKKFWDAEEEELYQLLLPEIEAAAAAGVEGGLAQIADAVGAGVDWNLVNDNAVQWASDYTYDLVKGITETSQSYLQGVVSEWAASGAPLSDLIDEIAASGMFGDVRAEMIAISEATRCFSEGNIAAWDEAGIEEFQFNTVDAGACDELCKPNNGKTFDLDDEENTPPLHTRCRCYPTPVVPEGE